MRNLRIAELLFNRPLMIAEDKLNAILHVLGPRLNLDLANMPNVEAAVLSDEARARAGYRVENGLGIVGVFGPLLHRRMASDYPSGGPTTYTEIRRSFDTAMADDGVREVKLEIDSNGGDGSGAFDLADHIYQMRGVKPITAVLNEKAFSAGYLLASAADRIIIPRTGMAGSIGVIASHVDLSRAEDAAGITVTHVYAGSRKADLSPHKPLSDEAMVVLQEMIGDMYEMFVETVARNRGMNVKAVRETEAGIFGGKKAVAIGLADEVFSANKALSRIEKPSSKPLSMPGGKAAAENHKGEKTMTKAELKEQHPALYAEIFEEGKAAGVPEGRTAAVTEERKRVTAILGIPGPAAVAHKALLLEGIEAGQSAGDVALAIQHKEAELLASAAEGIKTGAAKPAPPAEPGTATAADQQAAAAGDAMVAAAEAWGNRN